MSNAERFQVQKMDTRDVKHTRFPRLLETAWKNKREYSKFRNEFGTISPNNPNNMKINGCSLEPDNQEYF